jgi:hypothetical protein
MRSIVNDPKSIAEVSPATCRGVLGCGPAGEYPVEMSSATTRYRCTACGNLTRFDVTVTRRTKSFHHYSLGGLLEIEDIEVLAEEIEEVLCRWCGTAESVVVESAESIEPTEPVDAGSDG